MRVIVELNKILLEEAMFHSGTSLFMLTNAKGKKWALRDRNDSSASEHTGKQAP